MALVSIRAVGTVTTASTTLVINPVDISFFDKFSITYKNQISSSLSSMNVEVATEPLGTASQLNWYQMGTAIIPAPSGINGSGTVITSAIENAWKWLRIYTHSTATAATSAKLTIAITGKKD